MQIVAIRVDNLNDPVEVNSWLVDHPGIVLCSSAVQNNVFYIVYQ